MEEEVGRGKWKTRANIFYLVLLCILVPILSAPAAPSEEPPGEVKCQEDDYRPLYINDVAASFCCQKCPAGKKLVEHCKGPKERTSCTFCEEGQWRDKPNYSRTCRSCRRACRPEENEVEESPCTRTKDRVCGCATGYYKDDVAQDTMECRECTQCTGPGEEVRNACTAKTDTECGCKESFYRIDDTCQPCETCSSQDHCPSCVPKPKELPTSNPKSEDTIGWPLMFTCGVIFACVIIMTAYQATKLCKKWKRHSSSSPATKPQKSETIQTIYEEKSKDTVQAVPPQSSESDPLNQLPDCVPWEIKIDQLIYSVLDEVPLSYIKQLVRALGVSEREIERAREDHHAIKEAHYQMFRVWAEGGGGGGGAGGLLPHALLQDLLARLRELHLNGIAEHLENRYGDPAERSPT